MVSETNKTNSEIFAKDFKEIAVSEFISISAGLPAGIMLAAFTDKILLVPGLFVLLPGFLALKGNIHGSLSSRITSALNLGKIKPTVNKNDFLTENLFASIILSLFLSFLIGFVAYGITYFVFHINNIKIIWLSVIAAILANTILLPVTILSIFWLYKHGYNPDNIMGAYITSIGDVVSVISLLLAILIIT